MELISKLFKKNKTVRVRKNAMIFKMGGGWGDAINWMNIEPNKNGEYRVVGWKTPKPQTGDKLESKMESGKIGVFVFKAIEHCGDPQDMFFANVVDVGYLD